MSKKIDSTTEKLATKSNSKFGKLAIVISGIVLTLILLSGISYYTYTTSPNYTYYNVSQAIINNDFDLFKKYADTDSINSSFSEGASGAENFRKDNFKQFTNPIDRGPLAKTYLESFSDKLKKDGDKYKVTVQVNIENPKVSFPADLIISKVGNDWKFTAIKYDLAEVTKSVSQAYNTQNPASNSKTEIQSYDIKFGDKLVLNGTEVSIVKVEAKDSFIKPDKYNPATPLELKPANSANKLVKVIYSAKNTTKEPDPFYDIYSFQLVTTDNVKYKSTDSLNNYYLFDIDDTELPAGSVKNDYSSINPGVSIAGVQYYEVPKSFDLASSYLEYNHSGSTLDPQKPDSFQAKFRLQ